MASVLSAHRPVNRKPPEPVSGTFVWKEYPAPDWSTPGLLIISTATGGNTYTVEAILDDGRVLGFTLAKLGRETVYHVNTTEPHGWTCECWDALVREKYATDPRARYCKHVTALQSVLGEVGRAVA
jgi:hypothetical protein